MKTQRKPRSARKAPLIASLALACAFVSGNVSATIPVADVGNAATHIMNQIQAYMNQLNTLTSKIQDATQYAKEIQHMTQQLTQLDQMFASLTLTMTSVQEKTPAEMSAAITQRCASTGGSMLSDLFSTIGLDLNGDITAQQKQKCAQIVSLEFQSFNEQVRMLKKLQKTQGDITRLSGQLGSSNTNGKMDSNSANSLGMINQALADAQYSETVIRAYGGMIDMLKEDQKQLAKRAMDGQDSMIGSMVSTAVLAGALEIAD